ncbi:MAG TPA: hypothetical protein ENG45_00565 [Candidatus Aenigmarchaeota archaeon]|nr:hypothetical protein [Candidatus Aenigmarchaeota archaeon]
MKFLKSLLRTNSKYEKFENLTIAFIVFGTCLLSVGIGLSIFSPKGLSPTLAMAGAFIAFTSTVVLIFLWTVREVFE